MLLPQGCGGLPAPPVSKKKPSLQEDGRACPQNTEACTSQGFQMPGGWRVVGGQLQISPDNQAGRCVLCACSGMTARPRGARSSTLHSFTLLLAVLCSRLSRLPCPCPLFMGTFLFFFLFPQYWGWNPGPHLHMTRPIHGHIFKGSPIPSVPSLARSQLPEKQTFILYFPTAPEEGSLLL